MRAVRSDDEDLGGPFPARARERLAEVRRRRARGDHDRDVSVRRRPRTPPGCARSDLTTRTSAAPSRPALASASPRYGAGAREAITTVTSACDDVLVHLQDARGPI